MSVKSIAKKAFKANAITEEEYKQLLSVIRFYYRSLKPKEADNDDKDYEWPSEECRQEHDQLLGWLKELKDLRLENEVILRRLKHLLESDYISQFDQVDPNTKEYIRNIKEADWKVAYLCDQNKSCNVKCAKDHHCKRTCDISHAKNFRRVANGIFPITYEEVEEHCIANITFDREQLEKIVDERVIEPIKNGELVVKTEERPKGEWIYGEDDYGQGGWFCSECGFFVPWYYEFYEKDIDFIREYKACPHCIAEMVTYTGKDRDMREGQEDQ